MRTWVIRKIVVLFLFPFMICVKAASSAEDRIVRFQLCSEFLSSIPFQVGVLARRLFYERMLRACGDQLVARYGVVFIYPDASIGSNVLLGRNASIGLVDIGDDVLVAHGASLLSGRHHHGTGDISNPRGGQVTRIFIGSGTWIGAGAIIMADVGQNAVVGAGSVVVKPVPDDTIVAGNPAKVIRLRAESKS